MDMTQLPSSPGVYFLLGPGGRLLYVGKAADLRRRLADHARSSRWMAVESVRFEMVATAASALALEADILAALRPPWNKTHLDSYFSYVSIRAGGLVITGTGEYGCFPHLGKGALSAPGRACIDGFDALNRIVRATRPDRSLVHDFLTGRSDRLLSTEIELDQPHVAHGVRRDRIAARGFYEAGPAWMRRLRLSHGGRGRVTREQFVTWISQEVEAVINDGQDRSTTAQTSLGRTAGALRRRVSHQPRHFGDGPLENPH